MATVECPICGFHLKGTRLEGYHCAKCHSHFSGRFISHVQRKELRQLISKHFDQPVAGSQDKKPVTRIVAEERSDILVEDDAVEKSSRERDRITAALEETKDAARRATMLLKNALIESSRVALASEAPTVKKSMKPESAIASAQRDAEAKTKTAVGRDPIPAVRSVPHVVINIPEPHPSDVQGKNAHERVFQAPKRAKTVEMSGALSAARRNLVKSNVKLRTSLSQARYSTPLPFKKYRNSGPPTPLRMKSTKRDPIRKSARKRKPALKRKTAHTRRGR